MTSTWRVRALLLALLLGAGVLVYETWWNDLSSLNHYEALGMSESASLKDIKRAFRERSLQYHPDKSSSSMATTELNTKRFHRISGMCVYELYCMYASAVLPVMVLTGVVCTDCSMTEAYRVLSDESMRTAYDHELQERARFRAMQRQSWRVKLMPTAPGLQGALQFYVTEFPFVLAALVLHVLDVRLLVVLLVCLGCAIFAVDLVVRVVRKFWDVAFSSSAQSSASRKSNDAAMQAARLRQQRALEDARRTQALTKRRVSTASVKT